MFMGTPPPPARWPRRCTVRKAGEIPEAGHRPPESDAAATGQVQRGEDGDSCTEAWSIRAQEGGPEFHLKGAGSEGGAAELLSGTLGGRGDEG